MIKIISNGSKWAGQEPDTVEQLIEVLKSHDLDIRRFACHGFVQFDNSVPGSDYKEADVSILGNFVDVSHVFQLEGKYSELENVIRAIEKNIARLCDRIESKKVYLDARLPKDFTVFYNDFKEFVVCNEFEVVAKVGKNKNNVRASRTLEGAIQNYLKKRESLGSIDDTLDAEGYSTKP
jgi:hypothetical protein